MFLVWRGWGLLGLLLPAVSILVMWVIADLVFGAGSYKNSPIWPNLGLAVAGVVCIAIGRRLNGAPVPYLKRSVEPGVPFRPRVPFLFAQHNLLFIPLETIGVLLVIIGIVGVVRDIAGS